MKLTTNHPFVAELLSDKIRLAQSIVAVVFAVLLFAFIKHTEAVRFHFYQDSELTKQEALKHVPLGTDITTARKTMELLGFECTLSSKKARVKTGTKPLRRKDYLECEHDSLKFWARWEVTMEYEHNKVTAVSAKFYKGSSP